LKNTKTFRLFISSTFNDFRREREVLQTKVFPKVKEYCSKKGYTFQPIDLRWGISEEAQLDQKTLALCLDEVRSCKSYPYPNFLVMLGDRYGWVPLPYAIEKKEFEDIQGKVKESDTTLTIEYKQHKVHDEPNDIEKFHYEKKKARTTSKLELLQQWYTLDENQIPASYILNERDPQSDYKVYENWEAEENALRDLFQAIVNELGFTENQIQKYFISATESEINEGVIPHDKEHIFGFFRNVDKSTQIDDKFIVDDYKDAQDLKKRLKKIILNENKLEIPTKQIDKENLDEKYLIEFEKRIVSFFKSKIDEQISNEKDIKLLKVELQAQKYFSKQKRKNFIGQEKALNAIGNYIKNDETQPLVIYGRSGVGKSSLMAQSIDNAEKASDKKILFRFVGATPHSSSSKEILSSLFSELGLDVRSEQENDQDNSLVALTKNLETFEHFSERIYDEIMKIKENIVIFIDAVDQLTHSDQFLWLPEILPKNVKIIISVLVDAKYSDASEYYKELKTKSKNIDIKFFDQPNELLNILLEDENRTIQEHQREYFLEQYNVVRSPLYIIVAVQEIKHWRSFDTVEVSKARMHNLSNSQEGITKEFIDNLSKLYHHNEAFVQKVFGYIYASKDGLSESELLELISTDEVFVKELAPDTWHENKTKELPIVIWTRLYTQLKPFLSQKSKDGEEILYFFHREFEMVLQEKDKVEESFQKEIHSQYMEALIAYIKRNENNIQKYDRIVKLYASSILTYETRFSDIKQIKYYNTMLMKIDSNWLKSYLKYLNETTLVLMRELKDEQYYMYAKHSHLLSKELFTQFQDRWRLEYTRSLGALSSAKLLHNEDCLPDLEEATKILEPYKTNAEYIVDYLETSISLANCYIGRGVPKHAILNLIELLDIFVKYNNLLTNEKYQGNILFYKIAKSLGYGILTSFDLTNDKKILNAAEKVHNNAIIDMKESNFDTDIEEVSSIWNNIGEVHRRKSQFKIGLSAKKELERAILAFDEAIRIKVKLYKKNRARYRDTYVNTLKNRASIYSLLKEFNLSIEDLQMAKNVIYESYVKLPKYFAKNYSDILNNIGDNFTVSERYSEAIIEFEKALEICRQYNLDDDYKKVLQNLESTKSLRALKTPQKAPKVPGRNDPCPCKSGKKYKRCCGK